VEQAKPMEKLQSVDILCEKSSAINASDFLDYLLTSTPALKMLHLGMGTNQDNLFKLDSYLTELIVLENFHRKNRSRLFASGQMHSNLKLTVTYAAVSRDRSEKEF